MLEPPPFSCAPSLSRLSFCGLSDSALCPDHLPLRAWGCSVPERPANTLETQSDSTVMDPLAEVITKLKADPVLTVLASKTTEVRTSCSLLSVHLGHARRLSEMLHRTGVGTWRRPE